MIARVVAVVVLSTALAACAMPANRTAVPAMPQLAATKGATHFVAGFEIDTAKEAATAAGEGVTTAIEYGEVPSGGPLAKALVKNGITVIDGTVSGDMYYWECHRTHTVAPPPSRTLC